MRRVYRFTLLAIAIIGCNRADADPDVSSLVADAVDFSGRIAQERGGGVGDQHDFGPVLARGQTLRHEFTLTNPTNRPMRLIGAKLSTPCCSSLGPLPTDVIPPGDRREIAAFLRILSNQPESKKVGFEISTDSAELPRISFVLSATVWPEWEVQHLSDGPPTLLVGQSSRQAIRIVSRRIREDGLSSPTGIRAEPPLTARFAGEPREDRGPGDLVSITRDVEVQLPPSEGPGVRSASVIFSWAGDLNRTSTVL